MYDYFKINKSQHAICSTGIFTYIARKGVGFLGYFVCWSEHSREAAFSFGLLISLSVFHLLVKIQEY